MIPYKRNFTVNPLYSLIYKHFRIPFRTRGRQVSSMFYYNTLITQAVLNTKKLNKKNKEINFFQTRSKFGNLYIYRFVLERSCSLWISCIKFLLNLVFKFVYIKEVKLTIRSSIRVKLFYINNFLSNRITDSTAHGHCAQRLHQSCQDKAL